MTAPSTSVKVLEAVNISPWIVVPLILTIPVAGLVTTPVAAEVTLSVVPKASV